MPEEHEIKDSKKTKAYTDKSSSKISSEKSADNKNNNRTFANNKADNSVTEGKSDAKVTNASDKHDTSDNLDKNHLDKSNLDRKNEADDRKKQIKSNKEHSDKEDEMQSEIRKDKERFARKNEPKRRDKSHSLFLLIGVVALIALFVYMLLSSGVFTGLFRNDVIAKVNNEKIPLETFKSAYSQLPLSMQTVENKELLLSQMINRTLVLQEASKKGITVSDSDMALVLERDYKANFRTDEDYENALVQAGVTEEDLLELIYYQLSEEKLIEHLFPNVTAQKSEVEDFFNQNKEAIVGFYAAYLGTNVTTLDDIYDEIEEIVVLNKTIYLFSEYIDELLSKSDITINTELLEGIKTYEEEPEEILAELNTSDFVVSSEEIEGVEGEDEEIIIENDTNESGEQLVDETIEDFEDSNVEDSESNISGANAQIDQSEIIECLSDEGYLEKDVLVLYSEESEIYEDIIEVINQTNEEFTYKLVEVKSEAFASIEKCFNETFLKSVPQFICVEDLESLTQEFSAENIKSTLLSCKN